MQDPPPGSRCLGEQFLASQGAAKLEQVSSTVVAPVSKSECCTGCTSSAKPQAHPLLEKSCPCHKVYSTLFSLRSQKPKECNLSHLAVSVNWGSALPLSLYEESCYCRSTLGAPGVWKPPSILASSCTRCHELRLQAILRCSLHIWWCVQPFSSR